MAMVRSTCYGEIERDGVHGATRLPVQSETILHATAYLHLDSETQSCVAPITLGVRSSYEQAAASAFMKATTSL